MLFIPLSVEIYLSLAALYCLIVAVVSSKIGKLNYSFMPLQITVRSSILCVLLSLVIGFNGYYSLDKASSFILDQGLVFDNLSIFGFFFLSIFLVSLLSYYFSYADVTRAVDFEIPILMVYSFISLLVLMSSTDFIVAYLAIELQSLVFYILASSNRGSPLSTEAGLKYFVLGAFASALMLFGMAIIYFTSGTVDFYAAHFLLAESSLQSVFYFGLLFFISAILFKLSIFPFHSWTPDVYAGSPLPITAYFAILPKMAVIAFLIRLYTTIFLPTLADWNFLFVLLGLATLMVGTFGAIYQVTIKRLLAYSTVSHVGFMLIGFSSGLYSGIAGALFYVLVYSLTNLGIFGIFLSFHSRFSPSGSDQYMDDVHGLRFLLNASPTAAVLLALFLLSLSGVPPLAGFFAKYSILISLVEAGLYTTAVCVVLVAFVSAYYYLRLIKLTFFVRPLSWEHKIFDYNFSYGIAFFAVLNIAFLAMFETLSLLINLVLC